MKPARLISRPFRVFIPRWHEPSELSAIDSLSAAWNETLNLLFHPFIGGRWIVLSIVCLFLGGGTSTAAFQWGFGALPFDVHVSEMVDRVRQVIAQHLSLIVLAVVLSLGVILGLIYLRCVLRFVLIDAVIKRDVALGPAWRGMRSLGRSYFLWLVAVVGTLMAIAAGSTFWGLRIVGYIRDAGGPWWVESLLLIAELVAVVLVGLGVAVTITLTDDLVAPVMYAGGDSLPKAWATVWRLSRRDPDAFLIYIVLRFAASMVIGVAVLLVLFPALMGISSGALVTAALVVFAMRIVGIPWAGHPATVFLGGVAMTLLTGLLFALLSVIGMPGQVYLQNYGLRFIASRVPALGAVCRASTPPLGRH